MSDLATDQSSDDITEVPIKLVSGSKYGVSNTISPSRLLNFYLTDKWLASLPGFVRKAHAPLDATLENTPCRAFFNSVRGNFLVQVIGAKVFTISGAGLYYEEVGTLDTSYGECVIDENLASQICIVDGVKAYVYNYSTGNFAVFIFKDGDTNPLPVQPSPSYVNFHNTFLNFGNKNFDETGSTWYTYGAGTDTELLWRSQQTLQTKPDFPLAVIRIPGQGSNVLVIGTSVCEIFANIGGQINYRRNNSASIDYGCVSVNTIDATDSYIAWLCVNERNSPFIATYDGRTLKTISTDGISESVDGIKFPEQSTAAFWTHNGHLFYQLTFYNAADNVTWLYDFTNEQFVDFSDERLECHPALEYAYFRGTTFFGSLKDYGLYAVEGNLYDYTNPEAGSIPEVYVVPRHVITDNFTLPNNDRFRMPYLKLKMQQGNDPYVSALSLNTIVQYITGSDDNPSEYPYVNPYGVPYVTPSSWNGAASYTIPYEPKLILQLSYDGGYTWSNSVPTPLKPLGKRRNMLSWNRLGLTNCISFKFAFWSKSQVVVNNATLGILPE